MQLLMEQMKDSRKKSTLKIFIIIAALLGAAIFVYFKDPYKGPIFPCIFNKITNLYCPGCGMTRAINHIMHFRFKEALKSNFLVYLIPILIVMEIYGRKRNKDKKIFYIIILAIVLAFGVIRNFIPALKPI